MSELDYVRSNIEFNHAWGWGVHTEYVIHHIISGKGYLETGGKKYEINAGESFIIFPGSIIRYYPDSNKPWTYAWLNFGGKEAKRLIEMTAFSKYPVSGKADFKEIFESFLTNIREPHAKIFNSGVLYMLLSKYIETYPAEKADRAPDYIYVAKQYIEANCHRQEFTVRELAEAIGLERTYLYRLFKKSEGVSISEYIINTRLENAKKMLDSGITQIKVISFSSGYDNPLYFSNAFKMKYGLSPKNYLAASKAQKKLP